MIMEKILNAGIQVVPLNVVDPQYGIINKAIEAIRQSGLEYMVTPFETVVNGTMEQVLQLIKALETVAQSSGADELIINVRFHSRKGADNFFAEKISSH